MHRLDNALALACKNFVDEGIMEEMFLETKVIQLGEIVEELLQKVKKLEAHVKPSTPLEVLEKRRKVAPEVAQKIAEAEALCAKDVDQVS